MTNTTEFEIELKRANISKRELAKAMGISEMALYNKIHNIYDFKSAEIAVACNLMKLSLTRKEEVFFNQIVD